MLKSQVRIKPMTFQVPLTTEPWATHIDMGDSQNQSDKQMLK